MIVNGSNLGAKTSQKEPEEYCCKSCDYNTCKLANWKRHLKTKKHNDSKMIVNGSKNEQKGANWICDCGKQYKYDSGYYRHRKVCTWKPNHIQDAKSLMESNDISNKDKEIQFLKDALAAKDEKMDKIIDTMQQIIPHIGSNNNSHNNIFNIQLFLNEDCANAMTIQDFAKKLQVDMGDLDLIKRDESKAIAGMIKKSLSGLSQVERPMHSHAQKWYVKDKEEGWENDTTGKAIQVVKSGASKPLSKLANQKYKSALINSKDGEEYADIISKVNADVDSKCKNKVKEAVSSLCNITDLVD